jgi:hypothetical protein
MSKPKWPGLWGRAGGVAHRLPGSSYNERLLLLRVYRYSAALLEWLSFLLAACVGHRLSGVLRVAVSISLSRIRYRRRSFDMAQGAHDSREKCALSIAVPSNNRAVHVCQLLHAAECIRPK